MKRTISLIAALATTLSAFAQGPADALRLSQLSYEGSARTIAMGNAFTALGGDIGGIAVNPAASGVLRHSEIAISPGMIFSSGGGDCLGTSASARDNNFVIGSGGVTFAFDTYKLKGLQNFNFSIAAGRIADFNRTSAFSCTTSNSSLLGAIASDLAFTDENALSWTSEYNPYFESAIPWDALLAYDSFLVGPRDDDRSQYIGSTENQLPGRSVAGNIKQEYFSRSSGGIMQYALNFGFNFNSKVYFGFNLNFHSVSYSIDETYSESAELTKEFEDGFQSFSSTYWQTTTGTGINGKVGIIYTPIAGLRLGATLTTPTIYRLYDTWGRNMSSVFTTAEDRYGNQRKTRYNRPSPQGSVQYRALTPVQWSVGAAYTFGNVALVSVDYEMVNHGAIRLSDANGNPSEFRGENERISRGLSRSSIFRAGAEFRPKEAISLRVGYNHQGSAGKVVDYEGRDTYTYPSLNAISGGAGFRFGSDLRCSFDVAYQYFLPAADVYRMYSDYEASGKRATAPVVDGWNSTGKLILTFIYRF